MIDALPRERGLPNWTCWLVPSALLALLVVFCGVGIEISDDGDKQALTAIIGTSGLDNLKVGKHSWLPNGISSLEMLVGAQWLFQRTLRTVEFEAQGPLIDDARVSPMGQLTSLEKLVLRDARISDDGLSHLGTLTRLRTLELPGAPITDAGLIHLARMTSLKSVDLSRTKVTKAGVAKLQAALPKCRIVGP